MEISVVTIAELTHGIYRAQHPHRANQRSIFVESVVREVRVHDLTSDLATLVGRIEGEQAALGIAIDFQDLVIGATALSLDFAILTTNPKHFQLIPNLNVLSF